MIDENGYRANVGIVLADGHGSVFWAKRLGQDAWQFPQGGIKQGESHVDAMYRELREEIGVDAKKVKLIGQTRHWLRYRLPKRLIRHDSTPLCIGQKQKWFLLQYLGDDEEIELNEHEKPEFDHWQWVSYWYPVKQVIPFKQDVYRRALKELSPMHSALVKENEQ